MTVKERKKKGFFESKIRESKEGGKKSIEKAKLKENVKRREVKESYDTNVKVSI